MNYMKNKWINTADNTVLDCPSVNYKYNWDTYQKSKKFFWILSISGFVVALAIMIVSKKSIVQTIAGSFLGGILSLIVWLFTIRHQDKMNYEIATIDMHIMQIDKYLSYLHDKVQFINPDENDMVSADSKNLVYRFMHLFQLTTFLVGDKNIVTTELKLKYSDDKEYPLKEYTKKCDLLCQNNFADLIIFQEKWEKIIAWNYYTIDYHMNILKKKLMRYKSYVMCGHAPDNYKDYIS